jgi:hypothetical protein
MNEDRNQEPSQRLRAIISGEDEETKIQPASQSPMKQLPQLEQTAKTPSQTIQPQAAQPPQSPPEPASPEKGLKFGPAFWTITGILSLTVNIILIAVLLIMLNMLGPLQGTAGNIGTSILGGLYSNFEKMDRATIRRTIPVNTDIPLNITVPVQRTTQITLAEAVVIPNAQVVINTGGLNINSQASVTLPVDTPLTVNLDFDLPVQTTIPVQLDVSVEIPMSETELHDPFVGLQEVVRPLYCLVDSKATNLDGQAICR